jgi:hypothetical protein
MPKRPRTERGDVLRRFFSLSTADQLEAFQEIREALSADPGEEDAHTREVRERAAALEAIGKVSEHLGLPEGQAPTVQQFNETARKLGLGWGSTRVARIWGRWRVATSAYRGEQVTRTAASRSRSRRTTGPARAHEEYLEGIRRWLATKPASETAKDYDEWAAEQAQRGGAERLPVKSLALRKALGLGWAEMLAVARGSIDLASSRDARARKQLAELRGSRKLVAGSLVALVLGGSRERVQHLARHDPRFPTSVAQVGGARAWLLSDIEALSRRPQASTSQERRTTATADIHRGASSPRWPQAGLHADAGRR